MNTFEKIQTLVKNLYDIHKEQVFVLVYTSAGGTELRGRDKVFLTTLDCQPYFMSTDAYLEYVQEQYLVLLKYEWHYRNKELSQALS